jgi:DNA-binding IclR family transcriptional regulator
MSSLESAIRILQSMSAGKPVLRVSDVSNELDLPKSTVSRLLKTLSEGGLLERDDESRQYSVGPLLLQLGGLYVSSRSVLDLIDREMPRLVSTYGFTGYAGILDGGHVVVLRQWQGSHPLRFILDVGSRLPAEQTALGLALMADSDDAAIEATLGAGATDPVTGAPVTLAQIMHDVERCRRDEWIEVPCATAPGITAIGTVITASHAGEPSIGLSISFPDHAADEALRAQMASRLTETARRIATLANMPLRLSRLGGPAVGRAG